MPVHGHSASTNNAGAHTHNLKLFVSTTSGNGYDKYMPYNTTNKTITTESAGNHTHTVTIANTGGGQSHNNVQPYLTCYIFRRTA